MGGFGSVRSCPVVGKVGDVVNFNVPGPCGAVTLPRPFRTRRFWVVGKS